VTGGLDELRREAAIEVAAAHGNGAPITAEEREWLAGEFRQQGMVRLAFVVELCGQRYEGSGCDQCAAFRDAQANPDPA
jgi:hypothetical protein